MNATEFKLTKIMHLTRNNTATRNKSLQA